MSSTCCLFSRLRQFHIVPLRRLSMNQKDRFQPVIGLEVHAQLDTKNKLFSAAPLTYALSPNHAVAPVDAALPGALPIINTECVDKALLLCLALSAKVNKRSIFERKHYFYPDIPLGYQITQQSKSIGENGSLQFIDINNQKSKRNLCLTTVRIARIQLEQDTGKRVKVDGDASPATMTELVDLNRAGAPLVEIVGDADLSSSSEAVAFVLSLQRLLRSVGVSRARMERGEMRCDVNVSLLDLHNQTAHTSRTSGERVEIKNLNSLRAIRQSIEAEIEAQKQLLLESGGRVQQLTKTYSLASRQLTVLRQKEGQTDYRFLPDPDLPPLVLTEHRLMKIKEQLAHLPSSQSYLNFLQSLVPPLSVSQVSSLYSYQESEPYLKELLLFAKENTRNQKEAEAIVKSGVKWLLNEIRFFFKSSEEENKLTVGSAGSLDRGEGSYGVSWTQFMPASDFILFLKKTIEERLSAGKGKELLIAYFESSSKCSEEKKSLFKINRESRRDQEMDDDESARLTQLCQSVIAENDALVQLIISGNERKKRALIGKVMQAQREMNENFEAHQVATTLDKALSRKTQ